MNVNIIEVYGKRFKVPRCNPCKKDMMRSSAMKETLDNIRGVVVTFICPKCKSRIRAFSSGLSQKNTKWKQPKALKHSPEFLKEVYGKDSKKD